MNADWPIIVFRISFIVGLVLAAFGIITRDGRYGDLWRRSTQEHP